MRILAVLALSLLAGCFADSFTAPTGKRAVAPDSLTLFDLEAEDIESIEIIKAPDASTLYGSHSCGAIVITTSRAPRR